MQRPCNRLRLVRQYCTGLTAPLYSCLGKCGPSIRAGDAEESPRITPGNKQVEQKSSSTSCTNWVNDLADRLTHLELLCIRLTNAKNFEDRKDLAVELADFMLDINTALKCTYLIWLSTPQFMTAQQDSHITQMCEISLMRIYKAVTDVETSLSSRQGIDGSLSLLKVNKRLVLEELQRWSTSSRSVETMESDRMKAV